MSSALKPFVWAFIRLPLGLMLYTLGILCHLTIILSSIGAACTTNAYSLMRY